MNRNDPHTAHTARVESLSDQLTQVVEVLELLLSRIASAEQRLDEIAQLQARPAPPLAQRFDSLSSRLEAVERRAKTLAGRVEDLEPGFDPRDL